MKTYWGVEVQLHAFITSAKDGDEWSASRPGRFIPGEKDPRPHWIGILGAQSRSGQGKVKVKLSLCLTKYYAVYTYPVIN